MKTTIDASALTGDEQQQIAGMAEDDGIQLTWEIGEAQATVSVSGNTDLVGLDIILDELGLGVQPTPAGMVIVRGAA